MKINLTNSLSDSRQYYKGLTRDIEHSERVLPGKVIRETKLHIDSHTGTHIDYPAHFTENGRFGNDYPADYLISDRVAFADADLTESSRPQLTAEHILNADVPADCEILLVKTGFCSFRDEERYWKSSPVVHPELPFFLKSRFPSLKAVCFDIISVTSQLDKDSGSECHMNFLSDMHGEPILIVEDVNMDLINSKVQIKNISIVPLLFDKMDGAPCTIIAEIDEV